MLTQKQDLHHHTPQSPHTKPALRQITGHGARARHPVYSEVSAEEDTEFGGCCEDSFSIVLCASERQASQEGDCQTALPTPCPGPVPAQAGAAHTMTLLSSICSPGVPLACNRVCTTSSSLLSSSAGMQYLVLGDKAET